MLKARIVKNVLVSCLDTDGYVIIPKEVQIIGTGAFKNTKVMAVVLHEGVKEVQANSFENCKILNRVYIPRSVKVVGKDAFYNCPNLTIRVEAGTDTTFWHEDWECADEVEWNYRFKDYDEEFIRSVAAEMAEAILNLIKLRRYGEECLFPDYYEVERLRQVTSETVDLALSSFEEMYDRANYYKEIKGDKKLFNDIHFLLEFYEFIFKGCREPYITESDAKYWRNKCNRYTY